MFVSFEKGEIVKRMVIFYSFSISTREGNVKKQ